MGRSVSLLASHHDMDLVAEKPDPATESPDPAAERPDSDMGQMAVAALLPLPSLLADLVGQGGAVPGERRGRACSPDAGGCAHGRQSQAHI
jgi:hypothetical protein